MRMCHKDFDLSSRLVTIASKTGAQWANASSISSFYQTTLVSDEFSFVLSVEETVSLMY